jgi:AraC family transcriptional regulator
MLAARHAEPISLHALDTATRRAILTKIVPGEVTYASEELAWGSLLINVYRHRPNTQIEVPPLVEDSIVFNLCGATNVSGTIARRFHAEVLEPGNLIIIPKGEHAQIAWSARNDTLVVLPSPTLLGSLAAEICGDAPRQIALAPCINGRAPQLYQMSLALLSELRANVPPNDLYLEALTRMFGYYLLRHYALRPIPLPICIGMLAPAALRRVLDYIQAHVAEPMSVPQLAQEAQLSPYYFTRLFTQAVGKAPHCFVLAQRLNLAMQLLTTSMLPISDIATRTGFTDQSHLHRYFKRCYGITPGQIVAQRRSYRKERTIIQDMQA